MSKGVRRSLIGFLATLPLLIPQIIYLSDIVGWSIVLVYGLLYVALIAALVIWLILIAVEMLLRAKQTSETFRTPWFSLLGLLFLVTFFLVDECGRLVVLQIPQLCRVTQIVEWPTNQRNPVDQGTHSYVLEFRGSGNVRHHEFTTGSLNWTGDEHSGFPHIDLKNRTVSRSGRYYDPVPATIPVLRERIANSRIAENEADRISREVLHAIDLASAGKPVETSTGKVESAFHEPYHYNLDTFIGASIWMILLVVSFQRIAWLSLP